MNKLKYLTINIVLFVFFGTAYINKANSAPTDDFIMIIKSDNIGSNSQDDFTILTAGAGYNYNVDCNDDGIVDGTAITGDFTCDLTLFGGPGTYTIRIKDNSGTKTGFPRIFSDYDDERFELLSIVQWGTNIWQNMARAFAGARYLEINATDIPNLSNVSDFSSMLRDARLVNPDTTLWDISSATNLARMFAGAEAANPNTALWNTSNVTNMRFMFSRTNVANPDTSSWNTSKVTDMSGMFSGALMANPDTSFWNTSNVIDMSYMFEGAIMANPDTSSWNTSNVIDMSSMFGRASLANPDTSSWNTSGVTNMSSMFFRALSANPNTSAWDTSNVTNMNAMFLFNVNINPDTSSWDTSSVNTMTSMFRGASNARPDTSSWNTSSVRFMSEMFRDATSATPDTSSWDTSSVIGMDSMFHSAFSANPDTTNWNTSSATGFAFMFANTTNANPNTRNWDTSSARAMNNMFENAIAANPDVSLWNMNTVFSVSQMFNGIKLTTDNYDALLEGWSAQILTRNMNFNAGTSSYCAIDAHNLMTNSAIHNWNVMDGGVDSCDKAAYNSTPVLGTSLIFNSVNELDPPQQLSILIDNDDGEMNSILNGSCAVNGADSDIFTILNSNQFNIPANNPAVTLTLQCDTSFSGTFTSTLECSHDGVLNGISSPVNYPISCVILPIPLIPVFGNIGLILLILSIGYIGVYIIFKSRKIMQL